jgi:fumarylpyruvate hydrolase
MPDFVFDPPMPSVAIAGSERRFPVRRIYCVGRNYAAHAREMGADPAREPPFFFMKPADAAAPSGPIAYPPDTDNLHYEGELVVAIGHPGRDIAADNAWAHIFGYAPGVDLTRRDRQGEARAAGQPWERSKAFDLSAPIAPLTPAGEIGHMTKGAISLSVNGVTRQSADIADLIWSIPEIITTLSRSWALGRGDLIFTGTPEGVGPLQRGDGVVVRVAGLQDLKIDIV